MSHPYGVLPLDALPLTGGVNSARDAGFGKSLGKLSDEAIMNVFSHLSARDLCRLSSVSKAFYVFCNADELFKGLLLEEFEGCTDAWTFEGSWQESYLCAAVPGYRKGSKQPRAVRGLYSDLLYQPWFCTSVAIDPSWLEVQNIDRRQGLTIQEFKEQYETKNRPVIITDVVPQWAAMGKWDRPYLREAFKGRTVVVGDMPMSFDTYCAYSDTNSDELPLYLFDKTFPSTAPHLREDYTVPHHFEEDLFSLLGPSRPDYRWIIAGPFKSGSTWHVDPNATHAWNGVVRGRKKWVMYPPHVTPPGVRPSADGADVSCPVSLVEWFLKFYEHKEVTGCKPLEAVVREGELLFVPRGWWHMALNLEETVAVTQNYVARSNLPAVLSFLSSRNEALVSGCAKGQRAHLYDRFVEVLQEHRPELLEYVREQEEGKRLRAQEARKLSSLFSHHHHRQEQQGPQGEQGEGAAENGGSKGFAFGFCQEQEGGAAPPASSGPPIPRGFSFGFAL